MRLDTYLVERGLASSRTRAKELITNGLVTVNGKTVNKPAYEVAEDISPEVCVTGQIHPFVGRGGMTIIMTVKGDGNPTNKPSYPVNATGFGIGRLILFD